MIGYVLGGAVWLDEWLKAHLGRLYNSVLGIGIGLGIGATVQSFRTELGHGVPELKIAGLVAFQAILLLNQLAQLGELREARRKRRAAKQG